MTAALLDELGRPLFRPAGQEHHFFRPLLDVGYPQIDLLPRLGITGPAVLLARHLDGSMWVLPRLANVVCVGMSHLIDGTITPAVTGHRVWRPVNPHRLSPTQVEILLDLQREPSWGLTDYEHPQIGVRPSTISDARADLVKTGLVTAKTGPMSRRDTVGGKGAQVWLITRAGVDALVSPVPRLDRLLDHARVRAG